MLFNSIEFLFFFIAVTSLFFILPHRSRWVLLLTASCFFYMFFKPEYILILFFTIIVDYVAGIWLEKITDQRYRKWILFSSIVANVGILVIFKYYNFLNENITGIANYLGFNNPVPYLDIILPIGLSFHTFQAMSYTIEVYRRKYRAERHLGIYALYVMFYPQLVAGPIERPQNILPQFHKKQYFKYENATIGLNLIFWGLFKKIVIADRLAIYVNSVYNNPDQANSASALLAVFFFSFQIYCDFSGYSDIARGSAKVMGYDLMVNFRQPYLSKSFSEFWGRWHISLSTWFRDYVYFPLGGSKLGSLFTARNLLIVFILSGIWHGASYTFLVWGLLHAILLLAEKATGNLRHKLYSGLRLYPYKQFLEVLSVFFIFVVISFTWVFFRASTFSDAYSILGKIFQLDFTFNLAQWSAYNGPLNLALCVFAILILLSARNLPAKLEKKGSIPFAIASTLAIILLGTNNENQFIYFQF